ncbi:Uncharacterised protein (plasmid) [Tsukamurella tyrosinosolvens]|uniref:Uncharacterized protein n=1 Tax=Tsukamurella tyrosinosolvens TaxID=57704 RepID=A0A1H4UF92_TSUTY|nr:hypothetical protein [Tsukamurella tyrosinosolvens]KXO92935.1 hypothetical protein AXK58_13780 [Tsukamurella tyrosinosolvens]SEC67409.1 hypothetical protein SAMN04489793_2882 [Tsukamurella tyrosinosolvens]VEH94185.1 Uncharacterised protein [Tsukamurella tyrosinosolvens]
MYTLTFGAEAFTADDELFAEEGIPAARLELDFNEFNHRTGHDIRSPQRAIVYEQRINEHLGAEGEPLWPMQGPLGGNLTCSLCGGSSSTVKLPGSLTRADAEKALEEHGELTAEFRLSTFDHSGPGPIPVQTVLEGRCAMAEPGALDFDVEIDVPSGRLGLVDYIPDEADSALGDERFLINSEAGQLQYAQAIHATYGLARMPNYRSTFPWTLSDDPEGLDTFVLSTAWPEEWDDSPDDAHARAEIGLHTCIADRLEPAGSRVADAVWATIAGDITNFEALPGYSDGDYASRLVTLPVAPGRWRVRGHVTGPDEMDNARILTLTRIERRDPSSASS